MEKHKCKLCPRSFSNGRALGGHMKAHLAALPPPPKRTTQHPLGDTTESASSSSSGEEREQGGDDKSREILEEKSLAYALRNNPKRSFRFVDPEFSFAAAADSGSVVQDRESETESKNPTRRRSKRSRKLFVAAQQQQQQQDQKQNLEIKQPKLKKPSSLESPTEAEPVSSVSDTSPEEDVAMCLMLLSRDAWMRNGQEQDQVEMVKESEFEIKSSKIRGKQHHRCDKCRKVFRSNQALSGHKKVCEDRAASGTAKRNNVGEVVVIVNGDEKIFECPFCFKVFGSGQALGGHKRSHILAASSTSASATATAPPNAAKFENNLIDLNLPAPLEEDDYSVVSDA